jgi:hypothetical protein
MFSLYRSIHSVLITALPGRFLIPAPHPSNRPAQPDSPFGEVISLISTAAGN